VRLRCATKKCLGTFAPWRNERRGSWSRSWRALLEGHEGCLVPKREGGGEEAFRTAVRHNDQTREILWVLCLFFPDWWQPQADDFATCDTAGARLRLARKRREVLQVEDPPSKIQMGPQQAVVGGGTSKSAGNTDKAISRCAPQCDVYDHT